MTEQFYNNGGSDSSIFQARIREEDLAAEQKISEIIRAAEKFVKKVASQEQSYEQIDQKVQSELVGLLDRVESCAQGSDAESDEGVLQKIYECLKNFFAALGISVKEPNLENYLLNFKKEKDKNWLFSIIKGLCDKLRKLLSKVFNKDLNWNEELEQKIKKLEAKLKAGGMSEKETREVLEELGMLQELKLKFQVALSLALLTTFSALLEIDLRAAQAQETEENKKTESVSSKEPEVKQANEGVEVQVNGDKELESIILEPLFVARLFAQEIQSFNRNADKKPTIPVKPDLDPLRNLLENLKPELEKFIEPRQQMGEKPKQVEAAAPPPAAPVQPAPVKEPEVKPEQGFARTDSSRDERNCSKVVNSVDKMEMPTTKSIDEKKMGNLYAKLAQKITIAKGKPDTSKQNVAQAEPANNEVRSELNEVKKVEHLNEAVDVNCGRSI